MEYSPQIDKLLNMGVPNLYCQEYFDDEDFIYSHLILPSQIQNYITQNATISIYDYVINYILKTKIQINFKTVVAQIDVNPYDPFNPNNLNNLNTYTNANELYAKVVYVYQYVYNFYTLPTTMSLVEKINRMPPDLLQWITNIIESLRLYININPTNQMYESLNQYSRELLYGLNLLICHIKIIINHHKVLNLPIYAMNEKHINKFFRTVNNLCSIIIYFKFAIGGFD
jgi:hypothetical protein